MADVTAGASFALDFRDLSLGTLRQSSTATRTTTRYALDYGSGNIDEFTGFGFTFNSAGDLSGGTITAFSSARGGVAVGDITGLNHAAATFASLVATSDTAGALAFFLSGADRISGFALNDYLQGFGGADTIQGGGGADTLLGGMGDDILDGGEGIDTVSFAGAYTAYRIERSLASFRITDLGSGAQNGADILTNVERLQFSDRTLDLTISDPQVNAASQVVLRTSTPSAVSILVANGIVSPASATTALIAEAAATSSVATLSYEFFTGKIPSAAGMDFLVSPTGPNPNNLNSSYYQTFNLENRYINFAVNLGKGGEGRAAFTAGYGSLSLFDATKKAYGVIFGGTPTDAKVHAILDPVLTLNGVALTSTDYFAYYGGDGPNGIGTKAAMVGYLLAEAVKADIGSYAKSNDLFFLDASDANGATFNVDIVGVYGRPEFIFAG